MASNRYVKRSPAVIPVGTGMCLAIAAALFGSLVVAGAQEPTDYCQKSPADHLGQNFAAWLSHRHSIDTAFEELLEAETTAFRAQNLEAALELSARVLEYCQEHYSQDEHRLVEAQARHDNHQRLALMSKEKQTDYCRSREKLGRVVAHLSEGRMDEGMRLFEESLDLHAGVFGKDDLAQTSVLSRYAAQLANLQQYEKAAQIMSDIQAVRERHVGTEHPFYLAGDGILAAINIELGLYREAERTLRRVMPIQAQVQGEYCIDYISSLRHLARVLNKQQRFTEARSTAVRAVARSQNLTYRYHWWKSRCMAELARAQYGLGDLETAENTYSSFTWALTDPKCTLPHPLVMEILNDHAAVLRELGRTEEAEKLEAKRKDVKVKFAI